MTTYQTLDAIVVCWVLGIISFAIYAFAVYEIPQANLPILAGLVSGLVGTVVGGYSGFRWGASQADKTHTPGTASVSIQATTDTTETKT